MPREKYNLREEDNVFENYCLKNYSELQESYQNGGYKE